MNAYKRPHTNKYLMSVVDTYFDGVLERNPHIATVLGVHDYDSRIPSGSRDSVMEEIEAAEQARDAVDTSSYEGRLAAAALDYDLYEMQELRLWERNPSAVDAVISFIYPLWARDFAPLARRIELIADRLEDCPTYIRETRERVTEPVEIWVEGETEACSQLPGLLQLVADYAGKMERQDVAYRVNAAAEDTLDAVDEYREWLESLDAAKDWRIGEERLETLLDRRFLPPPDTVVGMAEREIRDAEQVMSKAVEEMGYDDPRDAVNAVESDTPPPTEVVEVYADEIRNARQYVDGRVASLPDVDAVEVSETPEHLTPLIPSGGYFEPAPLGGREPARYYVTANEQNLEAHSHAEILGTAVSEFYPGHHLQQVYPKESRLAGLVGRFNSFGDDFVEGWQLYSMDVMARQGYRDPELGLVRARDRIAAAASAIVDVELQRGGMTVREAAEYLAEQTGVEPRQAVARVRSYTENPGHQVSRLAGARLLHELRNDFSGMSEEEFHDALLRGGGAPVELHRERLSS